MTDTVYKIRLQSETKYEWTFAQLLFFSSTFDMDKLREIRWHHWKKGLKINDIAKFESDMLKTNEGIRVGGGGGGGGGTNLEVCGTMSSLAHAV